MVFLQKVQNKGDLFVNILKNIMYYTCLNCFMNKKNKKDKGDMG